MIPVLTPEESAALDAASAARGVSVGTLMENAGRAVARAAVDAAGGVYGKRAVVLCGRGNNGGDGLVAARSLDRWGMGMSVLLLAEPSLLSGETKRNFARFDRRGGRWSRFEAGLLRRELDRADVVVDAMFGTGFRGSLDGDARDAAAAVNASDAAVVAVDIPSGVEGETGAVHGEAVRADLTVTFGAMKPGVVFHPGASFAGDVELVDIGFPPDLVSSDLLMVERDDVEAVLTPRPPDAHKRSMGVVMVVAGSFAMTGAAVLAATAAYRAGAGLVSLAVPAGILRVVQAQVPEAVFVPLPETEAGTVSADAWGSLEERLDGVHAVAVGPGLTTDRSTAELVRTLVRESPAPLVVDADGLNAFHDAPSLLADRRADAILTPHEGEFARLRAITADEVREDRVGHVRKAADELRAVVVLKGPRTLIAEPHGRVLINPTGGSYLATGGTGDVLTGTTAALLARGLRPADAAMAAAYVHGLAGRAASAELGEGVVASDVAEAIPSEVAALMGSEPR